MLTSDSPRNARLQSYPWLKTEPKRRQTRRAYGHDYKAPGIYMITMTAQRNRPALSLLSWAENQEPLVELTPLSLVAHERLVVRNLAPPILLPHRFAPNSGYVISGGG